MNPLHVSLPSDTLSWGIVAPGELAPGSLARKKLAPGNSAPVNLAPGGFGGFLAANGFGGWVLISSMNCQILPHLEILRRGDLAERILGPGKSGRRKNRAPEDWRDSCWGKFGDFPRAKFPKIRYTQLCTGGSYTQLHTAIHSYTGGRYTQLYTAIHSHTQPFTAIHSCTQLCTAIHSYTRGAEASKASASQKPRNLKASKALQTQQQPRSCKSSKVSKPQTLRSSRISKDSKPPSLQEASARDAKRKQSARPPLRGATAC